jgi:hypothetical protein
VGEPEAASEAGIRVMSTDHGSRSPAHRRGDPCDARRRSAAGGRQPGADGNASDQRRDGRASRRRTASRAGLGNALNATLLMTSQGLLTAVAPLAAHSIGAGDHPAAGGVAGGGLIVAAAVAAPMMATLMVVPPLLSGLGYEPGLVAEIGRFLWVSPADEHRSGANQMRQYLSLREHFRRGNAPSIQIAALHH